MVGEVFYVGFLVRQGTILMGKSRIPSYSSDIHQLTFIRFIFFTRVSHHRYLPLPDFKKCVHFCMCQVLPSLCPAQVGLPGPGRTFPNGVAPPPTRVSKPILTWSGFPVGG